MNNSLVTKYFDFSQALEFLKEGEKVISKDYNPGWYFYMENNQIHLRYEDGSVDEIIESFDVSDILNEKWYIYENN